MRNRTVRLLLHQRIERGKRFGSTNLDENQHKLTYHLCVSNADRITNIVEKYVMVFRNQAPRFYIKENLPLKNQVIFGAGAPCALQEIVASLPSNAVRFCGGLIIMGDDAKIQNVRYIFGLIVIALCK